jgi:glycosyltransferase involved in cell wall biosynthesis
MASTVLSRIEDGAPDSAVRDECLSICLIGGIYGKNEEYRAKVSITPETTLESGLKVRGHKVITQGHRSPLDLRGMDIVHVHHLGYGALRAAASASDTPFIYTSHDPYPIAGLLNRPHRTATRFVMSRADAVVALSHRESEFQNKTYPITGAVQKVIPNGISTDTFQYLRNNGAGKGRSWKVLYVGQLIDLKGVDYLLRALTFGQQDIELQLIFNVDTARNRLENLAHELGLQGRVFFLGPKTPEELKTFYQRADLFVLPSLGEALPSVITEAMLCGTPVVATDVGGIRDQLGGYGLVVPPRDANALARAIGYVLSRYDEFKAGGEAMSQYAARRFSIPAMVESHLELYRSLLGRGRSRRNRISCRPLNTAINLGVRLRCKI